MVNIGSSNEKGYYLSKGGNMIGAVLLSMVLTLTLTGVGIYFGLPLLYPKIETEEGLVVEVQVLALDTYAAISDDYDVWNYHLIPSTNLTITVEENARLLTRFSALGFLTYSGGFINHTIFDIKLTVDGVGDKITSVRYFLQSAATDYVQLTQTIYVEYFTPALTAGTYNVSVYWRSRWNPTGSTQLSLSHSAVYNHTRTLVVEEIRAS